jgi:thioredoxin 1
MANIALVPMVVGLLLGGGLGALLGHFGQCSTGACPLTANPWRGGLVGAVIGGMFAFSAGSPASKGETSLSVAEAAVPAATKPAPTGPVHVGSAQAFNRIIQQTKQPVLVDFYADWCGPCRMLAPTIERLAKQYQGRAIVAKVNVDNLRDVAGQYGIQGIPAVLFFDKGKEVQRLVGVRSQSEYANVLHKLLDRVS